jgi:hypothetical protein
MLRKIVLSTFASRNLARLRGPSDFAYVAQRGFAIESDLLQRQMDGKKVAHVHSSKGGPDKPGVRKPRDPDASSGTTNSISDSEGISEHSRHQHRAKLNNKIDEHQHENNRDPSKERMRRDEPLTGTHHAPHVGDRLLSSTAPAKRRMMSDAHKEHASHPEGVKKVTTSTSHVSHKSHTSNPAADPSPATFAGSRSHQREGPRDATFAGPKRHLSTKTRFTPPTAPGRQADKSSVADKGGAKRTPVADQRQGSSTATASPSQKQSAPNSTSASKVDTNDQPNRSPNAGANATDYSK